MRPDVFLPILLGLPISLIIFLMLTAPVRAHLKTFRDKLSFFFWPSPPARMLIVQELDGEINIFYDDEYTEIKTQDRTLIRTVRGDLYITEVAPSQAGIMVSAYDAKAPEYLPSPFAVAWRWIVAAAILIFFMYYSLVAALIPPPDTPLNPWEILLAMTSFMGSITWLLTNVVRMNDRTILYSWYHGKGINPPHQSIIPVPGMSSISLLEYLEKLGREINIVVPQDISDLYLRLSRTVGSGSLAAAIMAKLAMAKRWREALVKVIKDVFDMWQTGEASAMVKMMRLGFQPAFRAALPAFMVGMLVGGIIGYVVGNIFTVTVAPPAGTPAQQPIVPQPGQQPGPGQQPPQTNTTTLPYQPAQPPPPPGVS